MAFNLSSITEAAFSYIIGVGDAATQRPLETFLTGGTSAVARSLKTNAEEYRWRNGGRQAAEKKQRMEEEAAAQAEKDAAAKLAGESMIASMPYASAFGSTQNLSLTPKQSGRSILGSF